MAIAPLHNPDEFTPNKAERKKIGEINKALKTLASQIPQKITAENKQEIMALLVELNTLREKIWSIIRRRDVPDTAINIYLQIDKVLTMAKEENCREEFLENIPKSTKARRSLHEIFNESSCKLAAETSAQSLKKQKEDRRKSAKNNHTDSDFENYANIGPGGANIEENKAWNEDIVGSREWLTLCEVCTIRGTNEWRRIKQKRGEKKKVFPYLCGT